MNIGQQSVEEELCADLVEALNYVVDEDVMKNLADSLQKYENFCSNHQVDPSRIGMLLITAIKTVVQ